MLNPVTKLNCGKKIIDLTTPAVMGILNITPDSFFEGSRVQNESSILAKAEKMMEEGADILDLGAMSSRPGADEISEKEELNRLIPAVKLVLKYFPETTISIDTYRSNVARQAIAAGAAVVNDISGGGLDEKMFETITELKIPYILMHMKGTPQTMQQSPSYKDVCLEILDYFILKTTKLKDLGAEQIIIDPGFGFGKTIDDNYEILKKLHVFQILDYPILAGLSRKSMIYKVLKTSPEQALNGTSVLNFQALQQGAKILRVHDIRAAREVISLWQRISPKK